MNCENEIDQHTGNKIQETVENEDSSQTELLYDLLAEMRLP